MKPGTFVKVTAEVWNLEKLSPRERVFLALLIGFTKSSGACTMSNDALGEWFGCAGRTVQHYLTNLNRAGYIAIHYDGGRKIVAQIFSPPDAKNLHQARKKTASQDAKNLTHIHKGNDIYTMNNNVADKIPTVEQATETIKQMIAQVKEFGHVPVEAAGVMARECLTYYEARDYETRHGKIRRWRPVLESWLRRNAERIPKTKRPKRENTAADIKWHERRAASWRRKADTLDADDPQRGDFLKYADDEQRTADHIRRTLES